MKSKANIKGHAIHPILVSFPIAFFTGTLLFDVLGRLCHQTSFVETALYLEIGGIAAAVVAAVPGIIDYTFTVPPNSTGKQRAAKHGITNVGVLLFFSTALYCRLLYNAPPFYIIVLLEAIGSILLAFAGWMGGTLVSRNQIGIDIRYAGAGKWKEEHLEAKDGFVEIAIDNLKMDQMRLVIVGKERIVIAKTEDGYAAFSDRCPHRGGSLAAGMLICGTVQCPWHGSQFNVANGQANAGPAHESIPTYPLEKGTANSISACQTSKAKIYWEAGCRMAFSK